MLKEFVIPDGVRSIGDGAFANTSLTSINIHDNITEIGHNAFGCCSFLKDISIGRNVKKIGTYAFDYEDGSPEIVNVTISDLENWLTIEFTNQWSNPLYAENAETRLYINNEIVKSLEIPRHSTSICDFAFIGCSSIQDVTIHDGVLSIGEDAFAYCI